MRRLNINAARKYIFKFRVLFPVIGILILYFVYKSEIKSTTIPYSGQLPTQKHVITEYNRYMTTFQTNHANNSVPKERGDLQQNGDRKETGNQDIREVKLVANDERIAMPEDNVEDERYPGTFSPSEYPSAVNLTGILNQYDMKGYSDEQPVNDIHYRYFVNPRHICNVSSDIKVLFIVKSSPWHTSARQTIRETWANTKRFPSIRIIFSFGTPKQSKRLEALLEESSTHKDILIVKNYIDNYYNLTLKTVSGLKWAVTHCARASYVVSVDDDIYVAPDLLLRFLHRPQIRKIHKFFSGHLLIGTKPIRNPKDKWAISLSEYPFQNYPNYIFGGFVIMSMSTVKSFTIAAQYTKLFKFEDVYLGILAAKLGIEATNNGYVNSRKTFTVSESFRTIIASHFYSDPKELQRAWDCHLSILDKSDEKSIFCDYIGKRLKKLKSEIDSIVSWMENVKFNS
ncbi:beta-1,3-galactosyltransferase brn-like [Ylistrum balloti]|uniref:beta-1,3-galactosyltransferase brn-like n=1 Tax=Ylistrum balloti TaxID=509963 RepID=UPI002905E266|nr:beta-1,3-galactosyltransferase brn-like [Ylistrum balloti]